MNRSHIAMRELLAKDAPAGLRWIIDRARAGDHQQTPLLASPSALNHYFAARR